MGKLEPKLPISAFPIPYFLMSKETEETDLKVNSKLNWEVLFEGKYVYKMYANSDFIKQQENQLELYNEFAITKLA